ncbi:prepilin-type N-terminal cleavage/methylation domain-containing protein, partial [Clostridium sporogenes]|nr:prepilin-type N-terminal cleavage/methylation domain-containing protein [Clostridium sporogenes]
MKLTLKKMKKKKGFTLIELMVVISIILVLTSFL